MPASLHIQVLSATSEEGRSVFPDEAYSGGKRGQWEDHADPAANEAEAISFTV